MIVRLLPTYLRKLLHTTHETKKGGYVHITLHIPLFFKFIYISLVDSRFDYYENILHVIVNDFTRLPTINACYS